MRSKTKTAKMFVLIPAAGVGARFGGATPKQYLKVAGQSILEHVVAGFTRPNIFSAIHLAISDADAYYSQCNFPDSIQKIMGGDTRQASVWNLLNSLKDIAQPMDWVLVHDAARPTLSQRDLNNLIQNLANHNVGGILAKPISSTVKFSENSTGDSKSISRTLDRKYLWEALTPQMFRYKVLYDCMQKCKNSNMVITDESQAVELAGLSPQIIKAQDPLLKLTHASDLPIIEVLLNQTEAEICV